jgi:phosphoglycolate phosphatase
MSLLLLFDFDYTLADSSAGIVESINYALQKMGFKKAGHREISKLIGLTLEDTFLKLTGENQEQQINDFKAFFKIKADEVMIELTFLYDSVSESFHLLKEQGYQIAIVSTKIRSRIEDFLQREEILDRVDLIIGGNDVKNPKPDPEGVFLAAAKLHASLRDCIFIGDSIVDAQTASNANIPFIASLTGATKKKQFQNYPVQHFIHSIKELPEYLLQETVFGQKLSQDNKGMDRQRVGI